MRKTQRRKIHEALYYLLVVVIIIFISGALFLISPLLIIPSSPAFLYATLIILGISLGAFLREFLQDLDELTHKHHTGIILIVLASTIINFITIITTYTILTDKAIFLSIISAFVFTISFLIPNAYQYYKKNNKKKK